MSLFVVAENLSGKARHRCPNSAPLTKGMSPIETPAKEMKQL